MSNTDPDRLFIGIYPCGIVYADRMNERAGDYKKLAFLSYATLELTLEKGCLKKLVPEITDHAASIQVKRGQVFQISTCGQAVVLGERAA